MKWPNVKWTQKCPWPDCSAGRGCFKQQLLLVFTVKVAHKQDFRLLRRHWPRTIFRLEHYSEVRTDPNVLKTLHHLAAIFLEQELSSESLHSFSLSVPFNVDFPRPHPSRVHIAFDWVFLAVRIIDPLGRVMWLGAYVYDKTSSSSSICTFSEDG